jgi:hypothetical protein
MSERLAVCGPFIGSANKLEYAGHPGQPVYPRIDKQADFIDQSRFQECAIDPPAALKKDCLNAKGFAESMHRAVQVTSVRTSEQI